MWMSLGEQQRSLLIRKTKRKKIFLIVRWFLSNLLISFCWFFSVLFQHQINLTTVFIFCFYDLQSRRDKLNRTFSNDMKQWDLVHSIDISKKKSLSVWYMISHLIAAFHSIIKYRFRIAERTSKDFFSTISRRKNNELRKKREREEKHQLKKWFKVFLLRFTDCFSLRLWIHFDWKITIATFLSNQQQDKPHRRRHCLSQHYYWIIHLIEVHLMHPWKRSVKWNFVFSLTPSISR